MSFVMQIGPNLGAQPLSNYFQRLLDSMRRILGDAPADWLHDAVRLAALERGPALRASTYAVALLLQQVEERLRAILLPVDFVPLLGGEPRRQELDEIARTYQLDAEKLKRWQRCHILLERALSESSPTQEASDLVGEHASLFADLLDSLTKHFENVLKKIDLLPAQPDEATVKALLRTLPESDVVQERLLRKLPDDGRYLDVLRLAGFFRRPPAPVRNDDGTIRYHPSWPASQYLVKAAKQFPSEVGTILNEIPLTHNFLARGDLAKAASHVPTPMLIAWLRRELSWFLQHKAQDEQLEDELGKLAGTLIEREDFREASNVLRQLLEYPSPKPDENQERRRLAGPNRRQWYAQGILGKQIPLLIQKQPQLAFDMLCAVLRSIQLWHGEEGFDFLSSRREQIAPRTQSGMFELWSYENRIIDLVLDAAESLAKSGQLAYVIDALRSKPGDFFRRMTLHLLRCHPAPQLSGEIRDALLNEHAFAHSDLEPEYGNLLAEHISSLSAAERGRIWDWLRKGPPADRLDTVRSYFPPDEQSAEVKQYVQRWRYRWMRRLQGSLPPTLRQEYEGLERRYAPEAKELPPALLSPQELLALDQTTLLARLQEKPAQTTKQRDYEPTQADRLREAVAQAPRRFAEQPGLFSKLTAEYQGAFFEGLGGALSKPSPPDEVPLSLSRVLLLARDLVQQASLDDRQHVDLGIARVLHAALVRREKPLVSITEFDIVFSVIEGLLRRPEAARKSQPPGPREYATWLLNTARGLALSSLFAAARWKKKELAQHGTPDARLSELWPSCAAVLTGLLAEGDPLVHASLGEHFWHLRYLDEGWLQANVARIFPTAPDQHVQFDAAWSMFLSWSGSLPDESWLPLLRPYYEHVLELRAREIAESSVATKEQQENASDRALARDLGALYLHGLLDLAPGDLLDRYFTQAGDEDASTVVNVLRHQLEREAQRGSSDEKQKAAENPTEQLAVWVGRARELWKWRQITVLVRPPAKDGSSEAAAFAHMFLLEHFSADECLDAVEKLLPIAALNAWDSALLNRLATLAPDYPGQCLRLAREFVVRGGYPDRESTRSLLKAALHCGDSSVEGDARAFINQLAAGGYSKVDDLLSEDAPQDAAAASNSAAAAQPLNSTTVEANPLRKVRVEGFKSLESIELELGLFNVFIGANGCGKSNILEALGVLGAAAFKEIEPETLIQRGVRPAPAALYQSSFARRNSRNTIGIAASSNGAHYQIELLQPDESGAEVWRVQNEMLDLRMPSEGKDVRLLRRNARVCQVYEQNASKDSPPMQIDNPRATETYCGTAAARNPQAQAVHQLLDLLKGFCIFTPSTPVLRGLVSDPQRVPLGLGGSGLPSALRDLLDMEAKTLGPFDLEDVYELLGWAQNFEVVGSNDAVLSKAVHPSRLVVQFRDRYMQPGRNTLTGYDASEGALHVLFYLALAAHPNAPRLCAVDNFDQYLHPRLVARLTHFVGQELVSDRTKQWLLTTHNPLALDGLDLSNDEIRLFVVDRDPSGPTKVRRIQVDADLLAKGGDALSLSRLWTMGRLGGVPEL